jgi:outer membrane protein OmpA-like peptidoglycan-associated protein
LTNGNETVAGMRKSRKGSDSASEGSTVPAYIVTFSDMVTLLLTFFVLLISLANVQDPELFNRGRDSFWESIKYCGLGMLFGKRSSLSFDNVKTKYLIEDEENASETRGIDEQREKNRRVFGELQQSMRIMPSQIVSEQTNFIVTDIRFSQGQATLDKSAEKFLMEFSSTLQSSKVSSAELQNVYSRTNMARDEARIIYVLGLGDNAAGDLVESNETEKQQWMLSAKRAQAVADFLEAVLFSQGGWNIYSWGAGSGGQWIGKDSPISGKSHIYIAVLHDK